MAGLQRGQYQGAGALTGRGLRLRHVAHKYRLPLTAVRGRMRLPLCGMRRAILAAQHEDRAVRELHHALGHRPDQDAAESRAAMRWHDN